MDSCNQTTPIESTSAACAKPWLNKKGHKLTDCELKEISKNWDEIMWSSYLDSLDGTLSDRQIHPNEYEYLAERMSVTCWEYSQTDADDDTKKYVGRLLRQLSPQQQKIINMIFWEGRSERYIAEKLNIGRTTVQKAKKRALDKMSVILTDMPSISPLVRGEKFPITKGAMDDKGVLRLAKEHISKAS